MSGPARKSPGACQGAVLIFGIKCKNLPYNIVIILWEVFLLQRRVSQNFEKAPHFKTRLIVFALILVAGFSIVFATVNNTPSMVGVKIYFIDSQMMRLLPVQIFIADSNPQKKAEKVIDELIAGRDDNNKIRRTIPKIQNCMSVKVKGTTAYVNLTKKMAEEHPDGRENELLTVYSIVNSLAEIDGIKTVRFTVDGETTKDFMGYIDMRETFIPDYFR